MSSFFCPICGKAQIDTPQGYVGGCIHYGFGETETGAETGKKKPVKVQDRLVRILNMLWGE